MKTTLKLFLLISLTGGLFLTSCKKNSSKPSTIDLITKSPWKFSKATANSIDVSALVSPCIKDNQLTFLEGTTVNQGQLNEGATKCATADPQIIDFTWIYESNFSKITITPVSGTTIPILPGGSNEFNLVRVSETELVLSQTVTFSATTQLVEVIMVH